MPSVRSSFTLRGQNLKIPKTYFCYVITSVSIALPYVGKNDAYDQGRNFANLGGVRGCPAKFFCLSPFFLSDRSSPMVLCPVNCPEEVTSTTIFALKRQNFRGWGRRLTAIPLKLVPAHGSTAACGYSFHKAMHTTRKHSACND